MKAFFIIVLLILVIRALAIVYQVFISVAIHIHFPVDDAIELFWLIVICGVLNEIYNWIEKNTK